MKTDGALTRYYTLSSWCKLVDENFQIKRLETLGNKGDIIPIPGGKLKSVLQHMIPGWLTRFYLNQCKMGSFLICEMVKK
jgi:hypothetical protein